MRDTRLLKVHDATSDDPAIIEAARVLRGGGLVAFPTETVYGLGAVATDAEAVRGIFAAKGRPPTNPLIVHAADREMARSFAARWPEAAEVLAEALWPGPVTLVVEKRPTIPDVVTAGLGTVGLRIPAAPIARALIAATGAPVAAPSANPSERISPTRAEHVLADLRGRVDLVLDGGPATVGIESTVVDVSGAVPRVLRPGPVGRARLEAILGRAVEQGATPGAPHASPGMMTRHYAPDTPSVRLERGEATLRDRVAPEDAVIVVGPEVEGVEARVALADEVTAARQLYEVLRWCDGLGAARIVVVMPPREERWRALRDRLERATVPDVG